MDTAKTIDLKKLPIKKLKEMLKKHKSLPRSPQNDDAIRSLEWTISWKKRQKVVELTEDAKRGKLESLKSIFRVRKKIPEVFRGQVIGVPISEKGP